MIFVEHSENARGSDCLQQHDDKQWRYDRKLVIVKHFKLKIQSLDSGIVLK